MEHKDLTIMFTDIKGFTSRTSQQSRSDTIGLIRQHKELLIPVLESKGGQIVKEIGDSFLVVFQSPTDAVLTGIKLQNRLREYNQSADEKDRLEIRVAINTGEVTVEDGDVYGEPVNIAARLEGIAEANEVYFTEATYLVMNKTEVPTAEIGFRVFKGIPDRIKIFKVLKEGESRPIPSAAQESDPQFSGEEGENEEEIMPRSEKDLEGLVFIVGLFLFMALGMALNNTGGFIIIGLGAGFGLTGLYRHKKGRRLKGHLFMTGFFVSFGLGIACNMTPVGIFAGLALGFGLEVLQKSVRKK